MLNETIILLNVLMYNIIIVIINIILLLRVHICVLLTCCSRQTIDYFDITESYRERYKTIILKTKKK